ncbi:glycosyltransferase [Mycoplasmopsis synoviae]|uniref:Glycosyl transferase family 2 n=1 Tax=Mycoplasmopsis synoviae TaxID=2109 RepID=A0A3B0PBU5_MYCSY|nr:glycosyltransferase [Mycoplasmopsis synoviae]AKB11271.1 hypothetical protein VY93_02965 [Mycoplasmopsis synoviae ATCC 25204]UBM43528.1 glycosyltransferase [Mycoplasmopsis synoviae]UZW64120.1 glycosyltransferase [Mycoplasmopsis synoviae]SYV93447.1 Glycosyl transferase family 2 [Mycoplasmopsis synoviae]
MKITLISLNNFSVKKVSNYLQDLSNQLDQNFEVVFCLQRLSKSFEVMKEINSFAAGDLKNKIKIVYFSKSVTCSEMYLQALNVASGNYSVVLNSDASFKKDFVTKVLSIIKKTKADLIEYRPRLFGVSKYKPNSRLQTKVPLDIAQHKLIFAYSFPFLFNKIVKTDLAKEVKVRKFKDDLDNKFLIELNYFLLLLSKKYYYYDETLTKEYVSEHYIFDFQKFRLSFKNIKAYLKEFNLDFEEEFQYAKYFFYKLFSIALVSDIHPYYKLKNKAFDTDLKISHSMEQFNKLFKFLEALEKSKNFDKFLEENKYMLHPIQETKNLKKKLHKLKIHKLFQEI